MAVVTRGEPLREHVLWVTASGGVDHAVAQVDLASGVRGATGGYLAVCGDRFWAAPMIAEPGSPCYRCQRYMRARATLRSFEDRLNALPARRRRSIVRRVLAMAVPPKPPVDSSRPAQGEPRDESTGRHARPDFDAQFSGFLSSGSRRVSTVSGRAS